MRIKLLVEVAGNSGLLKTLITNQNTLVNITYVHENYSYS
jgi:hypothetical protein